MLNINLENIEKQKETFRQLLGERFIEEAEEYSQLFAQGKLERQPKGYTPFFDFWHSYNLDIKTSQAQKQLVLSPRTYFLLDLLDQLCTISDLPNFLRIVKNLRVKNTFYSAAYEASVAALYRALYSVYITQEEETKTPDFNITLSSTEKVYIECKSLEDFSLGKGKIYQQFVEKIEKICRANRKSNEIVLQTTDNIEQRSIDLTVKKVRDLILNNRYGEHILPVDGKIFNCRMKKIADWDQCIYGEISVRHPINCESFTVTQQFKILPSRIQENKNIILVAVENYPILDFEKRIKSEIGRARKQLPHGSCNILHIQLPISEALDFEQYINNNYDDIRRLLENSTSNINAVIISKSIYNSKNVKSFPYQFALISNNRAAANMPVNFRYPLPQSVCLPGDLENQNINSNIEIGNIKYTPHIPWDEIPCGAVAAHMMSPSGQTQFRLWKSCDGNIAFEFIIPGVPRRYIKSRENPFIVGQTHRIDIHIVKGEISLVVNNKKLDTYIEKRANYLI